MTSADAAIAGGLIGRVYGTNVYASNFTLYISEIDFGAVSGSEEFTIRSGTSNANSRAMTFAGGVVGYVSSGENFIDVSYNPGGEASTGAEGDAVIFSGNVVVNSVQNGVGPAYAGGIFGYNAFELPISSTEYTFNLTSESASLEVAAEQTETSTVEYRGEEETRDDGWRGEALTRFNPTGVYSYDVCSGLYTSVLPDAYSINNLTFNANNATATARRLAGSTAVGDIAAGAIAGKANGSGDTNSIATIENLTVNLNTCSINAFGYSFDSDNRYLQYGYSSYWLGGSYWNGNNTTTVLEGNNVYAGGVIGYVCNYGDYDNSNQSNNIGLNYITVNFDRSLNNSDYAVYGIQNAVSGNDDYKTEGYVGGMFGMMESGYATNLTVNGTSKDRTVIYFNSTNDPNTSSVGGLIGATRNLQGVEDDSYAVTNSKVTDVHVAGRAYVQEEVQTSDWRWDIYVGGAIGVFGTANKNSAGTGLKGSNFARGITVEDCAIEAIGDEAMLTYAGGVFGGVWWVSSANISNCISRNNSVLASSATFNTFAAGIVGLLQAGTVENCLVINNTIDAITYSTNTSVSGSEVRAYAAGICARVYQSSSTIQNNISNAVVSASAPYITSSGYAVMAGIGITDSGNVESSNYFVAANIEVDNIDNAYAVRTRDGSYPTSYNSYAIALSGSSTSHTSNGATSHNMNVYNGWNVYSGLGISSNEDDIAGRQYQVGIVGNGGFTLNGLTFTPNAQGTYYAQILIDGELLCSYPIIVENASKSNGVTITTPDFTMPSADGTTTNAYVNAQNSHNFWSSAFGNSTQVDFSKVKADKFGTSIVSNVGGSIFTIIGDNGKDEIGTEHDDKDITHLYFQNKAPENADAISELTGVISFKATSSGTLVIDAITNNSDNAIHPILYKVDGDTITHTEYTDLASAARKSFSIKIDSAGTYYVGFRGNGHRIYSINMVYEGDGAHSANSGTTYFQIYAGDMSYVQNVIVSNSNVYMPEIYLVQNGLLGYVDGGNNDYDDTTISNAATQITQNLGNATSITGVMSYFNVSTTDDGLGLNISPVLGNTTGAALVLRYTTGQDGDGNNIYYYVIIEVVPNAIVGLSIAPADDTPPRATTTDTSGEKFISTPREAMTDLKLFVLKQRLNIVSLTTALL